MAVTIEHVETILKEVGIQNYGVHENHIRFSMGPMDRYVTPDGTDALRLVIELTEEGEYFKIFSPRAYQVTGEHVDAFLRATAILQWKTKLIQFEWDPTDGEVRPIIEWPIEDGSLTATQLGRCISGLVGLIEDFHPVLERARIEGVVEFPDDRQAMIARLETLLAKLKGADNPPSNGENGPPTAL